ncbi:DUF4132 domain-containing protein [Streptomyces griseomycini]|uniref:DUF4132 domain-containing protein n=1 Tax=Streptomyces griseomycini TaxID=66895 RepID=UPI0027E420C1|nr:DUF4132 domain-containing protein [Streptomyces griseomycini]
MGLVTVVARRDRPERHGVTRPFGQGHREVYPRTGAERTTRTCSSRFAAHVLRRHRSHSPAAASGSTGRRTASTGWTRARRPGRPAGRPSSSAERCRWPTARPSRTRRSRVGSSSGRASASRGRPRGSRPRPG